MKKFPFLLLDAGPIIKLFELGVWDTFIQRCDVTITRTVADEAKYASPQFKDVRIDLESYEQRNLIRIVDVDLSVIKEFYDRFDLIYKSVIDPGEKETLTFVFGASEKWLVCSADSAVFKVLALLGKAHQGISLEEILCQIGLSQPLEWQYSKRFRETYTHMGQMDSIQDKGFS